MDFSSCIGQKGVVEEISDVNVSVSFTKYSACGDCHAQGICASFFLSERKIVVENAGKQFQIGEEVNVLMERKMGLRATLIAYLFPFILMLCMLIVFTKLHMSELASGISILLLLAVYFMILYLFRDRLKKQFYFILEKCL
jgi:positive regulator of sigma E activity